MVIREDNWRLTLGFGQGALVRVVQGLSEVLQRKQKHGHTTTFIWSQSETVTAMFHPHTKNEQTLWPCTERCRDVLHVSDSRFKETWSLNLHLLKSGQYKFLIGFDLQQYLLSGNLKIFEIFVILKYGASNIIASWIKLTQVIDHHSILYMFAGILRDSWCTWYSV